MSKTAPKKTLNDLRALHDRDVLVPNRIRAAIAALAASGNEWAYEIDFLKLTSPPIGSQDISKYRDQFTDFWASMPATNGRAQIRRVWFVSKKLADAWKGR